MTMQLVDFSQCHARIRADLKKFGSLPGLVAQPALALVVAQDTLDFFRNKVFAHHAEEERDLFSIVLARAAQGAELEGIRATTQRLTQEHRQVESMWASLEPEVAKLARGEAAHLDATAVQSLVQVYSDHATFEETEFLPLCHAILQRTQKDVTESHLSHRMAWAPTMPAPL
ncbi:hemerythrin domain-containing protein [Rhodoferax sp.]|uniref:hemerythrin domain-containing protein n=1 Tax=Rhodoferax sp. TaxID=50421 RepID=UPI00274ABA16|nr:hemerythrin domain-containing protein [Rhodoferax sp.]